MDRTFGALPRDLQAMMEEIVGYAHEVGLDFPEVRFIMLNFDEMNKVAAYDGFPSRYPHWRFGMEYERLRKSYAWGLHRIYEMVINTDPCYAYLLTSNLDIDQKLVMAHVYGHADFFKHNLWFAHTNRRMLDETANHGARIRRYVERYGLETVETFVDRCLSLENLIDLHSTGIRRQPSRVVEGNGDKPHEEGRLPANKGYMESYINPPEYLEAMRQHSAAERQKERNFPAHPQRDVLLFLLEHAPLEAWQQDVLAIIREEAYYFAPQRQTKIMNEGWACAVGDTLVSTNLGLLRLDEIVENRLAVRVSDGATEQQVYDWAKFEDRATIRMTTRRGFVLEGSVTHRVRLADGVWKRLDELQPGDTVEVACGIGQWPTALQPIYWQPIRRTTLQDVTDSVGVNISTVIRQREPHGVGRQAPLLAHALTAYEDELATLSVNQNSRFDLQTPTHLTADFAAFLGYLTGDGHIRRANREVGLTTADDEQAEHFMRLGASLFGLTGVQTRDGNRWRVCFYSQSLIDLLLHLGLLAGVPACDECIPAAVLQSPKAVVSAFLRAYFDCDGDAGEQGVILNTSSERLSEMAQVLLLQFGILARRQQSDGGWHVHVTGPSAQRFAQAIGFGLTRKQAALTRYVNDRQRFKAETWVDEVATLEPKRATVYDLSVAQTHCYAANGLINHNSYWHSHIMTRFALKDHELIDYADHHSGTLATAPGRLNPYKVGIELFRHIEERWNRGAFGPEYEACDDLRARANWDKQLGLGREKIFEVRRIYNDIGFIETFLTPEFAAEQRLFTFAYNPQQNNYEIASREFEDVKRQLLFNLTNFGDPIIEVTDANYQNRGELYLKHHWDAIDLRIDYAEATLENLQAIWGRPVHLETVMGEKGAAVFSFDGSKHSRKLLQHLA